MREHVTTEELARKALNISADQAAAIIKETDEECEGIRG